MANSRDYCTITSDDPSASILITKEFDKLSLTAESEEKTNIVFSAVNSSGDVAQVSIFAEDGKFYTSTDSAYLFQTSAAAANINGTDQELEHDRNNSDLYAGAVSVKADQKTSIYAELPEGSMTTDISELPGGSFALTVQVNGADGESTLYMAGYSKSGRMQELGSAKTVKGQKTYVFTVKDNFDYIKILLLDNGTIRPLGSSLEIKKTVQANLN